MLLLQMVEKLWSFIIWATKVLKQTFKRNVQIKVISCRSYDDEEKNRFAGFVILFLCCEAPEI